VTPQTAREAVVSITGLVGAGQIPGTGRASALMAVHRPNGRHAISGKRFYGFVEVKDIERQVLCYGE